MLKYIICFWSQSGSLLLSRSFGFKEKDPVIISGLLAALSGLATDLGGEIKSIDMFNHRVLISIDHGIAFTVIIDEDDNEDHGKFILEMLTNAFFAIHNNLIGKVDSLQDTTIFKDLDPLFNQLPILKNSYHLIEKSTTPQSVSEVQEKYWAKFQEHPTRVMIWEALHSLSLADRIVEVEDPEKGILYRKKGELLKSLGLKLKS